jgi:succinate dehydrogenase/fumarate reductase flavoprotein subunit
MECPAGAVAYHGMQYQINQENCVSCGVCEEVCPISAVADTDRHNTVPPHEDIYLECDVAVVGGGTGLVAAVRAAQRGKRVILLEKAKKVGGNTNLAHGFFPVYTKWHERQGFKDMREEAILTLHERSGGIVDKDILRAAVYGSGYFFDWLCEYEETEKVFEIFPLGGAFAVGPIVSSGLIDFPHRREENLKCRDQAIGPGWSGTFIKNLMLKECDRLGVRILTDHAVKSLISSDSGVVTGLVAEYPGGRTYVSCSSCILATGGLGRSDEKLRRYFPGFMESETPIHRFSVPTDTGDGIDLAGALGAEIPEDRMFCSIFGPAHHPFSYVVYRLMLDPRCVYINLKGKRWKDETGGLMGERLKIFDQPNAVSYGILSQSLVDAIAEKYRTDPAFRHEAWLYEDYQKEIDEEEALGLPIKKAGNLRELAEKMAVDPKTFEAEIQRYNQFCVQGKDADYGKDSSHLSPIDGTGPFYAFYGQCFSEGAFGGLRVSAKTEVLKANGEKIEGLYAIGDATSAIQIRGSLAVISELTWATASAYIAGGEAS